VLVSDSGAANRTKALIHSDAFLLAAIVALFLCRAVAASAIVPAWQGPDEPSHFAWIKLLASPRGPTAEARQDVERQVLASMAQHRWWKLYQESTPSPVPHAFTDVPSHLSTGTLRRPAYYWLAAGALRVLRPPTIDAEYLWLRILSIALTVATLVCGWAGTRLLFDRRTTVGVMSLAALHPQFLLTSISVNPDVLINLCGAAVWWRAACLHSGTGSRVVSVVMIAAAAVAAALAKRNGMPLRVVAAVVLGVMTIGVAPRRTHLSRNVALAAVAVTAAAVFAARHWIADAGSGLVTFTFGGLVVTQSLADVGAVEMLRFLASGIDTSWLVAGWLRFPAPEPWLWIARALTCVGLIAAAHLFLTAPTLRPRLGLAWLFVAITAMALLPAAFVGGSIPQGRYFFVAFVPAMVLLWIGLQHCVPERRRPTGALAIVAVAAVLDVTGFATVLIPAYRL
jgi:hypothetical protein